MKRLDHYWNSLNFISLVLLPLSGLFCIISMLRSKLYRLGIFPSYTAPVPVVVVGNITVGGTGKTPLIIELVKQLESSGWKPGVISRGYGGAASSWPQLVDESSSAEQVGDEPKLIHQRTRCPMVVGPNRKHDIELLLEKYDCNIVLSDDGMQHYALHRDIEIAVIDARRRFGNGFCIPSGPLRETVSRLQQVNMLVLNGGAAEQSSFNMMAEQCNPVGCNHAESVALKEFIGKTVHAVAGIGNPERFFVMLEKLGINIIPHAFSDHHAYCEADFAFDDQLPVLMTEKDAVKCNQFNVLNYWSVPVEISLSLSAQQQLDQIFSALKNSLKEQGV